MKRFLVVVLLILLVTIGLIGIRFGSALFQEENTFEILASITKLEFSDNHYIQVTDTSQGIRFVSKNRVGSQEQIIKDFLEEKEWEFKEQMGSGYFFEKDGVTVVVETRLYTKNYFLWIVPNEVFN